MSETTRTPPPPMVAKSRYFKGGIKRGKRLRRRNKNRFHSFRAFGLSDCGRSKAIFKQILKIVRIHLQARGRKSDKKPLHTYVWANKDGLDFEVEREKAKDSFAGKVAVICDNPKAKVAVENNSIRITIDNPQGDIAFFIVLTDNFEKKRFQCANGNAEIENRKRRLGGIENVAPKKMGRLLS